MVQNIKVIFLFSHFKLDNMKFVKGPLSDFTAPWCSPLQSCFCGLCDLIILSSKPLIALSIIIIPA